MKSVVCAIGAILIILLMPAAITSIDSFRMKDYTQTATVVTGGGETTANVVLTQDLYSNATYNVSITSNVTTDSPMPNSYTTSTNTLNVSGLTASTSRLLTIVYEIDALTDFWGASEGVKTWPVLIIVGVIGIIAAAGVGAFRREN